MTLTDYYWQARAAGDPAREAYRWAYSRQLSDLLGLLLIWEPDSEGSLSAGDDDPDGTRYYSLAVADPDGLDFLTALGGIGLLPEQGEPDSPELDRPSYARSVEADLIAEAAEVAAEQLMNAARGSWTDELNAGAILRAERLPTGEPLACLYADAESVESGDPWLVAGWTELPDRGTDPPDGPPCADCGQPIPAARNHPGDRSQLRCYACGRDRHLGRTS